MSQSEVTVSAIKDMEAMMMVGREKLFPSIDVHGSPTEAERRYNTCCILFYLLDDDAELSTCVRHMLFEDEDIPEDLLDSCMTAVHLERGLAGVAQLSLGNRTGLIIIGEALQELDGKGVSSRALVLAQAMTNILKKNGMMVDPEEELAEESSP